MTRTYVVDVAEYQGSDVDFAQIEREGFGAAMIKLSGTSHPETKRYGPMYIDPTAMGNAQRLLSTGLVKIAYHYLSEPYPVAQAAMFSELLGEIGYDTTWGAVLDIEDQSLSTMEVNAFLGTWAKLNAGRKIGIYSRQSFWQAKLGAYPIPALSPLITARWVAPGFRNWDTVRDRPILPGEVGYHPEWRFASQQIKGMGSDWNQVSYGGRSMADLVQFTNNAEVANKRMDCSVFYGSKGDLARAFGLMPPGV